MRTSVFSLSSCLLCFFISEFFNEQPTHDGGTNTTTKKKTVTDPSIVMEQPQLPSPGLATFGSDSAIAEEEGAGGDVGLSMEGEVRVRAGGVGDGNPRKQEEIIVHTIDDAWLYFGNGSAEVCGAPRRSWKLVADLGAQTVSCGSW